MLFRFFGATDGQGVFELFAAAFEARVNSLEHGDVNCVAEAGLFLWFVASIVSFAHHRKILTGGGSTGFLDGQLDLPDSAEIEFMLVCAEHTNPVANRLVEIVEGLSSKGFQQAVALHDLVVLGFILVDGEVVLAEEFQQHRDAWREAGSVNPACGSFHPARARR